MLLKICELILDENDDSLSADIGRRWHIFENVSRVVYDDFVREIPDKETFNKLTSKYGFEAVHKILTNKYLGIYPTYCSFVSFLNKESKKELIVFDSCNAYLCDDKGDTITSFGCKVLQKKTKEPESVKKVDLKALKSLNSFEESDTEISVLNLLMNQPLTGKPLRVPLNELINVRKLLDTESCRLTLTSTTDSATFDEIRTWCCKHSSYRMNPEVPTKTELLVEVNGKVKYALTEGFPYEFCVIKRNKDEVTFYVRWNWTSWTSV